MRFSVGQNGRVLSAEAASAAPWPLLNESAVKLMGFKDPIGQVVKDLGQDWTIVGVIKDGPVNNGVPPVETLYHLSVAPLLALATSITVPASHLEAGIVVSTAGAEFTVAVTDFLAEIQPLLEAST